MSVSRDDRSGENGASARQLVRAAQAAPAHRDPYGQQLGYASGAPDAQGDFHSDFLEYWRIFNKRKWLIFSLAAAFDALGAVRTLMQTPLYTATARQQIDRNVAKVVEGGNVTPVEGADFEFLKTQYELLQSRTMAQRVASALNLGEDADFFKPREFSIIGAVKGLLKAGASPAD